LLQSSFGELRRFLTCCFEAVFEGDLAAIESALGEAKGELSNAKHLAGECDPKLELYLGPEGPFNIDLCSSALSSCTLVLDELTMLLVAAKDWEPKKSLLAENGGLRADAEGGDDETVEGDDENVEECTSSEILDLLRSCPSFGIVKNHMLQRLRVALEVVPRMLFGDAETAINSEWYEELCKVSGAVAPAGLQGAEFLYRELSSATSSFDIENSHLTDDVRVRLTVAVRCLENSARHLCKIEERCIKEASLE